MSEIEIDIDSIEAAIASFNDLEKQLDSGEFQKYSISQLINESSGRTFSITNQCYNSLQDLELQVKYLVSVTKQALVNAGICFSENEDAGTAEMKGVADVEKRVRVII